MIRKSSATTSITYTNDASRLMHLEQLLGKISEDGVPKSATMKIEFTREYPTQISITLQWPIEFGTKE